MCFFKRKKYKYVTPKIKNNKKLPAPEFEKISIRGRVAYGICCLENFLEKYSMFNDGWKFYLSNLWGFTQLSAALNPDLGVLDVERWFIMLYDSPVIIRTQYPESFSDFPKYIETHQLAGLRRHAHYLSDEIGEKEYILLKNTMRGGNSIIEETCELIYDIGCNDMWAGIDNVSESTLMPLQKLIDLMNKENLPLPSIEPFKQYIFTKTEWDYDLHGWGETFDGKQYSKFLK